jgi:hypothetical protein
VVQQATKVKVAAAQAMTMVIPLDQALATVSKPPAKKKDTSFVKVAEMVRRAEDASTTAEQNPDIVSIAKVFKGKSVLQANTLQDALTKGAILLESSNLKKEKAALELAVNWMKKALLEKEQMLQAMRRTTHVHYHRLDQGHIPDNCAQCTDLSIPREERPSTSRYLEVVKNTPNSSRLQCYLAEQELNHINMVKFSQHNSDLVITLKAEMVLLRQNLQKTLEVNRALRHEAKINKETIKTDRDLLVKSRKAVIDAYSLTETYKQRLVELSDTSHEPVVPTQKEHAILKEKAEFYEWHNKLLLGKFGEMERHEVAMATKINHLRSVAYEAAHKTRMSFARTEKAETRLEHNKERLKQAREQVNTLTPLSIGTYQEEPAVQVNPGTVVVYATKTNTSVGFGPAQELEEVQAAMEITPHCSAQGLADAEEVMRREANHDVLPTIPSDLVDTLDVYNSYSGAIRGKCNSLRRAKSNRGGFGDVEKMENEDLKTLIQTFFQDELTGLSTRDTKYTIEEQAAVDQMNAKTTYDAEAKQWTTGLLFSENPRLALDNNRGRAKAVLRSIFKKLPSRSESDQILTKSTYNEMFDKFCRKVEESEIHLPSYTLESHAVYVPSSSTHPVRVVINAKSQCKTTGKSLNEILLQGPDYLPNLIGILLRFRTGKVAVVADISKMFLRIKMAKQDQRWLQVFRMMDDGDMELFCFISLAFGLKSAPFQAQWVIREHAKQFQARFPAAAEAVERDLYMDDLGKTGTREDMATLVKQFCNMFDLASMQARKWNSNDRSILSHLDESQTEKEEIVKVLGMYWNTVTDTFQYGFTIDESAGTPTKRSVARQLGLMWDCLGLLTPF